MRFEFCAILLLTAFSSLKLSTASQYYLDGSALILVEAGLSAQQESDVLESTLYAQLMADHACDQFSEFSQWYAVLIKSYLETGWTVYTSDFDLSIDNSSSSDQEAIEKVLPAALNEDERLNVSKALNATHQNRTLETLLYQETSAGSFRNFQVLVTQIDDSNNVVLSFTGFVINVVNENLREVFASFGLGLLDESNFALHRKYVSAFVKDYKTRFISSISPS